LPKSECAASDEEGRAEPANGVSVERQKVLSVAVGRQTGDQQPDQCECGDHPAVRTVFLPAAEERNDRQDYGRTGEGYASWIRSDRVHGYAISPSKMSRSRFEARNANCRAS